MSLLFPNASMTLGAIALAFLAGGALSGYGTYKYVTNAEKAERLEAVTRAVDQAEALRVQDQELAFAHEKVRVKIVRIARDSAVEVAESVPINCAQCSLSPSGFGLLNRALSGELFTAPDSSEPVEKGGALAPTEERALPDSSGTPPAGGRPLSGITRQRL